MSNLINTRKFIMQVNELAKSYNFPITFIFQNDEGMAIKAEAGIHPHQGDSLIAEYMQNKIQNTMVEHKLVEGTPNAETN